MERATKMLLDMDRDNNIDFIGSSFIEHIWLLETEFKGKVPPPSLANTPLVSGVVGGVVGGGASPSNVGVAAWGT